MEQSATEQTILQTHRQTIVVTRQAKTIKNPQTNPRRERSMGIQTIHRMTEECGATGLCSTCAELWESEIDLEDMEAEEG